MKLKNPEITFLVGRENTTIEIRDNESCVTFVKVVLTPQQLSDALSRISMTKCECDVFLSEKLNKKMENKKHEFLLPQEFNRFDRMANTEILHQEALRTCPEGWIPDTYYASQDSFFSVGGKDYARCTIRRWI